MNDTQARGPRRWDAGNARPGKLDTADAKALHRSARGRMSVVGPLYYIL